MKVLGIPFIWNEYLNFKGLDINIILKNTFEDNKGFDLVGGVKLVGGENKGISITGLYNSFGEVNEWSISYATLRNTIKEFGEDAFYLQIGLTNRAGNIYFPIINVGGIRNIPKLIKKSFKRKTIESKT